MFSSKTNGELHLTFIFKAGHTLTHCKMAMWCTKLPITNNVAVCALPRLVTLAQLYCWCTIPLYRDDTMHSMWDSYNHITWSTLVQVWPFTLEAPSSYDVALNRSKIKACRSDSGALSLCNPPRAWELILGWFPPWTMSMFLLSSETAVLLLPVLATGGGEMKSLQLTSFGTLGCE